jgi:hypothetical protein
MARQNDQAKAAEAQAKEAIDTARENAKQTVESQRVAEEYALKRDSTAASLEAEKRKAIVQAVNQFVIAAMKPITTPGAEGMPGETLEPDFEAVLARAARLRAHLEQAAGLTEGIDA